jgi:hypothetical protein
MGRLHTLPRLPRPPLAPAAAGITSFPRAPPATRSRRRHRCSIAPRRGCPANSATTTTPCGEPWPRPRTATGYRRP